MNSRYLKSVLVLLLALIYPVVSFFWHHHYPFYSIESAIIFTGALLLAAIVAALITNSNEKLANCLLAMIIVIVLVIQFDLFLEGMAMSIVVLMLCAVILSRVNFRLLTTMVLTALIIGAFLDNRASQRSNTEILSGGSNNSSLPPVVHLILDSFIGPEGLPPQTAAQTVRINVMEFLNRNQFNAYPQAYTHYAATQDSLTNAFNFTQDSKDIFHEYEVSHTQYVLKSNKYLAELQKLGYEIQIFQSEFMDFCNSTPDPVQRCWTYNIPKMSTVHEAMSGIGDRISVLIQTVIYQSVILKNYSKRSQWYEDTGVTFYDKDVLTAIETDMQENAYGSLYFAHLLLPHDPFVMRPDCSLDYESELWLRYAHSAGFIANTVETRRFRYIHYLEQASCTLKILDSFFDNMRRMGIFEDSVIVIHGDHGSSIFHFPINTILESLFVQSDYLDAFSTLFAVKYPGHSPEIYAETIALEQLLGQVLQKLTNSSVPQTSDEPFVYISDGAKLYRKDLDIFVPP